MKLKIFLKKRITCLFDADSCSPISFGHDLIAIGPPLQKARSIGLEKQRFDDLVPGLHRQGAPADCKRGD